MRFIASGFSVDEVDSISGVDKWRQATLFNPTNSSQPMKPRALFRATCVVFTIAILVGTALLIANFRGRTARLPDGSILEIKEIAYARTYRYQHYRGAWWERGLNRVLPLQWRLRLNVPSTSGGGFMYGDAGTTNFIIVTSQHRGFTNNPIQLERIHVVDDDGSTFEAAYDATTLNEPGEVIQGWRFKAFPRRHKKVRCRFIYKDASGNYAGAAEMEIPNPVPGPHPQWMPEPLPATKRNGDLTVTLVDFVAGLQHEQDVAPKNQWYWIGRATTRATFHVQQAGNEHPPWKLQSLSVADATGNSWKASLEDPPNPPAGEKLFAEFIGSLWPSEPAWKLRVEFSRTNGFAPDELWTPADIAVPATNQIVMLNSSHETTGVKLRFVAIGGVGAELPEPFQSLASGGRVNLAVEIKSADCRLTLVKVVDDQRRVIAFNEPYTWFDDNHSFALDVPAGAKTISATFAIHRSRFVEFTAKPRRVGN